MSGQPGERCDRGQTVPMRRPPDSHGHEDSSKQRSNTQRGGEKRQKKMGRRSQEMRGKGDIKTDHRGVFRVDVTAVIWDQWFSLNPTSKKPSG